MGYFVTTGSILLFVTLFADYSIFGVRALRDMHIKVPEAVRVGQSVTLACDYDLESVALYSIKWYRYDEEFYRYVPKEAPPSIVFPMPHLKIDVQKSNSREVTLIDVERETSGEFKCEVSADAPLFHTDIRSAYLLVADIPEDGPVLRSEVQKVAPGGSVRANCTTPGSYPSMNITWFVNDEKVHSGFGIQIHDSIFHYDALPGKETVRSTISVVATSDLFRNGKMRLRCVASMFSLYNMSTESEVQEDTPQVALIMVPTTHPNEGTSNSIRNLRSELIPALLFFVHLHAWLRRIIYH